MGAEGVDGIADAEVVELMDAERLTPVAEAAHGTVALIAAYCGKTRLIDNRIL